MPVTLFPSPQHFWMESLGLRGHAREADSLPKASTPWQAPGTSAWVALLAVTYTWGTQWGTRFAGFFKSFLVSWNFLSKLRGVFFIRNCLYIPRVPLLFRQRETTLQQDLCFRHPRPSPCAQAEVITLSRSP